MDPLPAALNFSIEEFQKASLLCETEGTDLALTQGSDEVPVIMPDLGPRFHSTTSGRLTVRPDNQSYQPMIISVVPSQAVPQADQQQQQQQNQQHQ